MPEYSSTTITPADGVKTPAMNGSTSGNYTLSALRDFILASKGAANGLASLDANGKLNSSQIPDLADDVIVVDSYSTLPATGTAGKLYITADTNRGYRWDPDLATPDYVMLFENNVVFGYMHNGSFYEDDEYTVEITPEENILYIDVSISDIYVLVDGVLTELLASKWAKIADIQDGSITAGLATKAWQDAMGNAIITTYATKSELTSEATARANADSNLKGAIDSNTARIENLEQKAGGYSVVNYRGTNAVPSGKAKYGLVESIVGKSRAWNQLEQNSTWDGSNGTVSTITGGFRYTVVNPDNSNAFASSQTALGTIVGHKYLFYCEVKANNTLPNNNDVAIGQYIYNLAVFKVNSLNTWVAGYGIIERTANGGDYIRIYFPSGNCTVGDTFDFRNVMCRDLTLIFGSGNEPSTVAEAVALCPDILKYDAYGYSLPSTTVSGINSIGFNRYDGTNTMNKGLNNGVVVNNAQRWVTGLIPVSGDFTVNLGGSYAFFDINENLIGYEDKSLSVLRNITPPVGTAYVQFDCHQSTVMPTGFMLALGTYPYPGEEMQTYHPYMEDTLTLPSPFTGKSAGDVAEVYDLETGKVSHPIESYTFTGSEIWVSYASGYQSICLPKNAKSIAGSATPEMITDIALDVTSRNVIANGTAGISVHEGSVFISDTSFATSGKTINYVLATPDPDTDEGIVNNPFIETEGRGTINTIQTQSPVIDNSLDVGYLAV